MAAKRERAGAPFVEALSRFQEQAVTLVTESAEVAQRELSALLLSLRDTVETAVDEASATTWTPAELAQTLGYASIGLAAYTYDELTHRLARVPLVAVAREAVRR